MRRKMSCFILLLFLLCGLSGLVSVRAMATPYGDNGRLAIKNGKVVNESGKAFVIKGVSTHGLAWYPAYVNKKAFKSLRDRWGVNTIRLAMYTEEYGGYCSGGDQEQLIKLIDQGVSYATSLGMYVIIDWHILSDGNPLNHRKDAVRFFRKMAKKYKKNGHVLYEICNEPNGWEGSWSNIRRYAKSVIKTIREYDKKAIIIVGTPTWSQDVEEPLASPIRGYKNIAYAYHFYAATHGKDMRSRLAAVLKQKLPVIVTEFGISEASGNGTVSTKAGNAWIRLLDKYKVGRVCWNLSNKSENSALIKSDCAKTSGWKKMDLTKSGRWLRNVYQ